MIIKIYKYTLLKAIIITILKISMLLFFENLKKLYFMYENIYLNNFIRVALPSNNIVSTH